MNDPRSLKAALETHISSFDFSSRKPAHLYEPIAYILEMKGKRIRPLLCMMAYQAVSKRPFEEAMNLASAVELFHNFTLMHDDIMDRAPVRRGKPTVHKVWNEDIAILSGDALFAFSMGLVVQDFPQQAAALGQEFAQVSMEVCEGQMEDMDLADQEEADIPTYLEMIRKKTAALLGGCMSLGALAAGAPADLVARFKEFGESLGIGFQLQDDLMDAFPPANFGKQVGGDIIENKKTYLLLKALELADEKQEKALHKWLTTSDQPEAKVAGVLEIFKALDIEAKTQSLIKTYFDRAATLSQQLSQETDFDLLRNYLQDIFNRKL
ncbi:MAG: polyprenyl synthetase family protein [Bacteroidota bacterium]